MGGTRRRDFPPRSSLDDRPCLGPEFSGGCMAPERIGCSGPGKGRAGRFRHAHRAPSWGPFFVRSGGPDFLPIVPALKNPGPSGDRRSFRPESGSRHSHAGRFSLSGRSAIHTCPNRNPRPENRDRGEVRGSRVQGDASRKSATKVHFQIGDFKNWIYYWCAWLESNQRPTA